MLQRTDYRQHGAVLLVLAVIMSMVALGWLYGRMTKQRNADAVTARSLAVAQAALIGRALVDPSHPGSLPCPDTDNDPDNPGVAETTVTVSGGACKGGYIGRLPWRTLGLSDIRDGSGERLWYALSSDARDYKYLKINSQYATGLLQVNSNTNMVAVIFSSGVVIDPQQRGTQTQQLAVGNYLEGANADGDSMYVAKLAADPAFNDTVLAISSADLFRKVERSVLQQIAESLRLYAAQHKNVYPFAADQLGDAKADLFAGFVPCNDLYLATTLSPPATLPPPSLLSSFINTLIQNDWFSNNMAANPMLPYNVSSVSAERDHVQINLRYCSGSMDLSSNVMVVHCV